MARVRRQPRSFRLTEKGLASVLGPLEAQVMQIVWSHGPLSVRGVLDHMAEGDRPAYTTVMTVLQRLHVKGLLLRRKHGTGHVYRPALTQADFQQDLVSRLLAGLSEDFPVALQRTVALLRRRRVV